MNGEVQEDYSALWESIPVYSVTDLVRAFEPGGIVARQRGRRAALNHEMRLEFVQNRQISLERQQHINSEIEQFTFMPGTTMTVYGYCLVPFGSIVHLERLSTPWWDDAFLIDLSGTPSDKMIDNLVIDPPRVVSVHRPGMDLLLFKQGVRTESTRKFVFHMPMEITGKINDGPSLYDVIRLFIPKHRLFDGKEVEEIEILLIPQ